jgi:hypothetical protein
MALLIGGCPKRQTAPRLVYVPAPPAVDAAPAQPAGTLIIEEPAPPAPTPQETVAPEPTPPRPARRPRHVNAAEPPDSPQVAPEPDEPAPTVEVPALEPRESREQESALRGKILGLQNEVQQQVSRLERASLGPADRKTLEDARTFLAQSGKALEEGDLQRSQNLARKASLLVDALNKGR